MAERCPGCGVETTQPFERDADEPVAHIVRFVDELITADGEPFEDGILILNATLRAMRLADGGMSMSELGDVCTLSRVLALVNRQ
jgi:hypothetical protein